MIRTSDILDEKDKHLRAKNEDVEFPLSKETKKLIQDMLDHLYYSQIEEYSKKYDLRPGMGLAAPQLGINERFFVVCHEETENNFKNYILINPKMISHSEELIYASEGDCYRNNKNVYKIYNDKYKNYEEIPGIKRVRCYKKVRRRY